MISCISISLSHHSCQENLKFYGMQNKTTNVHAQLSLRKKRDYLETHTKQSLLISHCFYLAEIKSPNKQTSLSKKRDNLDMKKTERK